MTLPVWAATFAVFAVLMAADLATAGQDRAAEPDRPVRT